MIETEHLTKIYPTPSGVKRFLTKSPVVDPLTAVDNVSLRVGPGELFGLLGPNGAGKTTLMKILCTLLLPTSGRACVGGFDVAREEDQVKKLISLVPSEERSFYWRLSGWDNLMFFGRLLNLRGPHLRGRVNGILESVGLARASRDMVYTYSSGMRQKLCLARGLLGDPPILFLDEPMKAVDPISAVQIKQMVKELAHRDGKTVFIATHRLAEAEELCDRLAIMDKGRLIFSGTTAQLELALPPSERFVLTATGIEPLALRNLVERRGALSCLVETGSDSDEEVKLSFCFRDEKARISHMVRAVEENGGTIVSLNRLRPSLEEMFMNLIYRGSNEPSAGISDPRFSHTN